MATGVPYSIYAPDNVQAKNRSVSIFSRRTVMSVDEPKPDRRRDDRRDVSRKRSDKPPQPVRPFGQGKRLSLVKVSLDGSLLQPVPENITLANLEAAMLSFPKEMNTAIGRLNSTRQPSSDRRRQQLTSVYSTMSIDSQISQSPRRHNHNTSCNSPTSSPRRNPDKRLSSSGTSPREGTVPHCAGRVSQLRSKFAPVPPPKDDRPAKPVMKLRIPSVEGRPVSKPLRASQTRELPPVPLEEDGDTAQMTEPVKQVNNDPQAHFTVETVIEHEPDPSISAISSPTMTIDDSNLILHSSVTSPLVSAISQINHYTLPDKVQPEPQLPAEHPKHLRVEGMAERIDQVLIEPSMPEPEIAIAGPPERLPSRLPSLDKKLKTFYNPVESDSEDDDEPEGQSSGAESSVSSYEVVTPVDGQYGPISLAKTVALQHALPLRPILHKRDIGKAVRPGTQGRAHSTNSAIQRLSAPELVLRRASSDTWSKAERIFDNKLEAIMAYQRTPTTASLTPPLPRRSYMRYWQQSLRARTFSRPQPTRRSSEPQSFRDINCLPSMKRRNSDCFSYNPSELAMMAGRRSTAVVLNIAEEAINPDVAESVVLHILSGLNDFNDLISCALVNRGFYLVLKRNELSLQKKVLRNKSGAAWELHETIPKPSDEDGKAAGNESPATFRQSYNKNVKVVESLKALILARCKSLLRVETIEALSGGNKTRAQQITDALWRIWTFSLLFGSGKGRENDIVGQIDWLRGGLLAHQATCSSTIVWSEPVDLTSILLNPPDSFGGGNGKGLSIDELHDMTEMWNCLKVLLCGVMGPERVEQAREYGVFADVKQQGGPCEELLLEEWLYHLTTLGLSAVLDLVDAAQSEGPQVFQLAKENDWATWTAPPNGGTRSTFLKEAVGRVYEEKVLRLRQPEADGEDSEQKKIKQYRKLRTAIVAAELKRLKASPDYCRTPISQDRPMSVWSQIRSDRLPNEKQGFATILEEETPETPMELHPALREQLKRTSRNLGKGEPGTPKRNSSKRSTRSSRSSDSRRHSGPKCSPVQKKASPAASKKALPRTRSRRRSSTSSTATTSSPASAKSQPKPRSSPSTESLARTTSVLSSPFSMTLFPMRSRPNSATAQRRHSETPPSRYPRQEQPPALPPRPGSASPSRAQQREAEARDQPQAPHPSMQPARSRSRRPTPINRRSYYGVQSIVVGEASHDKALFRIVDMGFPIQDAREALKVTDAGNGINVDRAVAWLLNRQMAPTA